MFRYYYIFYFRGKARRVAVAGVRRAFGYVFVFCCFVFVVWLFEFCVLRSCFSLCVS